MNACLQELSQAYPTDSILPVMDNALGIHQVANHIGFPFIPPYIPDMNPIEQMRKELGNTIRKSKSNPYRHSLTVDICY